MNSEFGAIMQLGYVVENIEESIDHWVKSVGAGPFYMIDSVAMDHYYYRGEHTELELSLCFGYWNDMQIELIHQLSPAESFYSRALRETPNQLNHVATTVANLDELLDRHDLRNHVIQSGKVPPSLQFVYLENFLPGGLYLELVETPEPMLQSYAAMREVARHWDGHEPIRPMARIAEDMTNL